MLDLILLVLLLASFLIGAKRGFIVQLLHIAGLVIAFIVAHMYYMALAQKFVLWIPYPGFLDGVTSTLNLQGLDVDRTFYQALAFVLIFFAVKLVLQIIVSIFDFLAYFPLLNIVNRLLGAVLCFAEVYILLFIALYVCALIPIEKLQVLLDSSSITHFLLEKTPAFPSLVKEWWYIYINN